MQVPTAGRGVHVPGEEEIIAGSDEWLGDFESWYRAPEGRRTTGDRPEVSRLRVPVALVTVPGGYQPLGGC
ncbi:MAG: hypothetical protein OXS29_08075 [bacterium]|nr:hypothetical protein [bacterium]MDE0287318.1 hypothetical protein [bacterium]MDE0439137.1 hypothetical protein [bacterium]